MPPLLSSSSNSNNNNNNNTGKNILTRSPKVIEKIILFSSTTRPTTPLVIHSNVTSSWHECLHHHHHHHQGDDKKNNLPSSSVSLAEKVWRNLIQNNIVEYSGHRESDIDIHDYHRLRFLPKNNNLNNNNNNNDNNKNDDSLFKISNNTSRSSRSSTLAVDRLIFRSFKRFFVRACDRDLDWVVDTLLSAGCDLLLRGTPRFSSNIASVMNTSVPDDDDSSSSCFSDSDDEDSEFVAGIIDTIANTSTSRDAIVGGGSGGAVDFGGGDDNHHHELLIDGDASIMRRMNQLAGFSAFQQQANTSITTQQTHSSSQGSRSVSPTVQNNSGAANTSVPGSRRMSTSTMLSTSVFNMASSVMGGGGSSVFSASRILTSSNNNKRSFKQRSSKLQRHAGESSNLLRVNTNEDGALSPVSVGARNSKKHQHQHQNSCSRRESMRTTTSSMHNIHHSNQNNNNNLQSPEKKKSSVRRKIQNSTSSSGAAAASTPTKTKSPFSKSNKEIADPITRISSTGENESLEPDLQEAMRRNPRHHLHEGFGEFIGNGTASSSSFDEDEDSEDDSNYVVSHKNSGEQLAVDDDHSSHDSPVATRPPLGNQNQNNNDNNHFSMRNGNEGEGELSMSPAYVVSEGGSSTNAVDTSSSPRYLVPNQFSNNAIDGQHYFGLSSSSPTATTTATMGTNSQYPSSANLQVARNLMTNSSSALTSNGSAASAAEMRTPIQANNNNNNNNNEENNNTTNSDHHHQEQQHHEPSPPLALQRSTSGRYPSIRLPPMMRENTTAGAGGSHHHHQQEPSIAIQQAPPSSEQPRNTSPRSLSLQSMNNSNNNRKKSSSPHHEDSGGLSNDPDNHLHPPPVEGQITRPPSTNDIKGKFMGCDSNNNNNGPVNPFNNHPLNQNKAKSMIVGKTTLSLGAISDHGGQLSVSSNPKMNMMNINNTSKVPPSPSSNSAPASSPTTTLSEATTSLQNNSKLQTGASFRSRNVNQLVSENDFLSASSPEVTATKQLATPGEAKVDLLQRTLSGKPITFPLRPSTVSPSCSHHSVDSQSSPPNIGGKVPTPPRSLTPSSLRGTTTDMSGALPPQASSTLTNSPTTTRSNRLVSFKGESSDAVLEHQHEPNDNNSMIKIDAANDFSDDEYDDEEPQAYNMNSSTTSISPPPIPSTNQERGGGGGLTSSSISLGRAGALLGQVENNQNQNQMMKDEQMSNSSTSKERSGETITTSPAITGRQHHHQEHAGMYEYNSSSAGIAPTTTNPSASDATSRTIATNLSSGTEGAALIHLSTGESAGSSLDRRADSNENNTTNFIGRDNNYNNMTSTEEHTQLLLRSNNSNSENKSPSASVPRPLGGFGQMMGSVGSLPSGSSTTLRGSSKNFSINGNTQNFFNSTVSYPGEDNDDDDDEDDKSENANNNKNNTAGQVQGGISTTAKTSKHTTDGRGGLTRKGSKHLGGPSSLAGGGLTPKHNNNCNNNNNPKSVLSLGAFNKNNNGNEGGNGNGLPSIDRFNSKEELEDPLLFDLVRKGGRQRIVRRFFETNCATIFQFGKGGRTLAHVCCEVDDVETLELYCDYFFTQIEPSLMQVAEVDPTAPATREEFYLYSLFSHKALFGDTPLLVAAHHNSPKCLAFIVETAKKTKNKETIEGFFELAGRDKLNTTVLHEICGAARMNKLSLPNRVNPADTVLNLIKLFIVVEEDENNNNDVTDEDEHDSNSKKKKIKLLPGLDINAKTKFGSTPLIFLVQSLCPVEKNNHEAAATTATSSSNGGVPSSPSGAFAVSSPVTSTSRGGGHATTTTTTQELEEARRQVAKETDEGVARCVDLLISLGASPTDQNLSGDSAFSIVLSRDDLGQGMASTVAALEKGLEAY